MMRNRHASEAIPTGGGRSEDENALSVLSDDKGGQKDYAARYCNKNRPKQVHSSIMMVVSLVFGFLCILRMVSRPGLDQVVLSPSLSSETEQIPNITLTNVSSIRKSGNTTKAISVSENGTNDRYEIKKQIISLPSDPQEFSMIETMLQTFTSHDKNWYAACAADNGTRWISEMREHGGADMKFFDRACPNMGNHPYGVHWNPFHNMDRNCSATSRINIEIRRDHLWEEWQIQTLDVNGVPKLVGGDGFYIFYSEYIELHNEFWPIAVAIPKDHQNGTYGLEFVSVPFLDKPFTKSSTDNDGRRKRGRLTIYAITTCFIGELYQPLKDGWATGGSTNVKFTIDDIARPYGIQDWYADRYRETITGRMDPERKVKNSFLDFERIVFAGDSILTQMIWNQQTKNFHSIVTEKIKDGKIWAGIIDKSYGGPQMIKMALTQSTLWRYLGALEPFIRGGLSDDSIDNKALVIGSAAWDIIWPAEWQGPYFENHLSAVEALIKHLRNTYPDVTVVWKLPYAHHMHVVQRFCIEIIPNHPQGDYCIRALRYATKERFKKLYTAQKTMIVKKFAEDRMVQLLDLYEVTYLSGSNGMAPGDSIHYQPAFNNAILERLLYAPRSL